MTRRQAPVPLGTGVLLLPAVVLAVLGMWLAFVRWSSPGTQPRPAAAGPTRDVQAGAPSGSSGEERPQVGYLAPDFALPDLTGRTVRLSDFRGEKAVFLNFWATWCPPCRAEMPTMEQAYRDYHEQGLELLAVSVDTGPKDEVETFVRELKLTFPVLRDPDLTVPHAYRIPGLPGSVLIDRQGVVRSVEVGLRDWSSPASRRSLEAMLQ